MIFSRRVIHLSLQFSVAFVFNRNRKIIRCVGSRKAHAVKSGSILVNSVVQRPDIIAVHLSSHGISVLDCFVKGRSRILKLFVEGYVALRIVGTGHHRLRRVIFSLYLKAEFFIFEGSSGQLLIGA